MKSVIVSIFLIVAAGCASTPPAATQPACHAICIVCKHRADLACLDVAVDPRTPKVEYRDRTYYFCSDDCRAEFMKNPEKYANK